MLWGRRALVYNQCQRYYTASYGSCILSTIFSYHDTVLGDGGGGGFVASTGNNGIIPSFRFVSLNTN